MLESPFTCPAPNRRHIVHAVGGSTSIAPQLNYITDIVFELNTKLIKHKIEIKEIQK